MSKSVRRTHRTSAERSLEAIYAEIPGIPDCSGKCASACGPISMFKGEWERVRRSFGRTPPPLGSDLSCPMLSPTGKCMVYSVRPYICRLWGTTRALACPQGCEPERWLSTEDALDIYQRIRAIAGPGTAGPLRGGSDLWEQIDLIAREQRLDAIERIRERNAGTT